MNMTGKLEQIRLLVVWRGQEVLSKSDSTLVALKCGSCSVAVVGNENNR